MRKGAFTLIELIVSIILIGLIVVFLYSALAGSRKTKHSLERYSTAEQNRSKLYELLYRDLIESTEITPMTTRDERFTIMKLRTANSLYDIAMPYVTYYVHSQQKALIRLESAREIELPIPYDDKWFVYADWLVPKVNDFNVYTAQLTTTTASSDANSSSSTDSSAESRGTLLPGQSRLPGTTAAATATGQSSSGSAGEFDHILLYLNAENMTSMLLEIAL